MPEGPQGQKCPRDVISNAVKVMRIATGEEREEFGDDGKDPAALAPGAKGGRDRASKLSADQHMEIARGAANVRREEQTVPLSFVV